MGYEELRKLVCQHRRCKNGLAQPVKRPEKPVKRKEKEDGILTSQKILLTWMIEEPQVFRSDQQLYHPGGFYRRRSTGRRQICL